MVKNLVVRTPIRFFLLTLLGMVSLTATAQQANEELKSLVRQASKECRAAKTLRRSDLDQAQGHFKAYVELLNQAIKIKPDLLDNPDADTQRVLDFCNVVKADLDRAVALPLFERGIRECGEARVLVSNAAFDEAREKERLYREYKDGALIISSSVMEVYENSYEIRICDRLAADITAAEAEYRKQLRAATASDKQDPFQDILNRLGQADRQCRGAQNLIDDRDSYSSQTVTQVENLAKDSATVRDAAISDRDKLLAQGISPDAAMDGKIKSALNGIRECQAGIPASVARIKTALTTAKAKPAADGKSRVSQDIRQIVGAPAEYPRRALRRNIEGEVTVKFNVTRTGDVEAIEIVEANPTGYFEEAAVEAVSKYKFQPRLVNGDPVEAKGVLRKIVFKFAN